MEITGDDNSTSRPAGALVRIQFRRLSAHGTSPLMEYGILANWIATRFMDPAVVIGPHGQIPGLSSTPHSPQSSPEPQTPHKCPALIMTSPRRCDSQTDTTATATNLAKPGNRPRPAQRTLDAARVAAEDKSHKQPDHFARAGWP